MGAIIAFTFQFLTDTDLNDIQVYRHKDDEILISNEAMHPFPMAPYNYIVRHRRFCEHSNNKCSAWKTVADFYLDADYGPSEWKISEDANEIVINFPENTVVRQMGGVWVTETKP